MIEFDFGGYDAQEPWSIDSLNARLERLELGELLRIEGLTNEIYHGCVGISCSMIKIFMDCPYRYWAMFMAKTVPYEHKSHFDFGSAGHCIVLEPHKFESEYIKQPDYIKVRNGGKWDLFLEKCNAQNKTPLTVTQWDNVHALRRAIDAHEKAKALTSGGVAEVSYFKRDEETGLVIKCRPDYEKGGGIIDLKTSDTVKPGLIDAKFKKFGYHVQDAMYSDIVEPDFFAFVAIESKPPFIINAPVLFCSELRCLGYLKYRDALSGIAQCMESDYWPMYTDEGYIIKTNKFDVFELEKLKNI